MKFIIIILTLRSAQLSRTGKIDDAMVKIFVRTMKITKEGMPYFFIMD